MPAKEVKSSQFVLLSRTSRGKQKLKVKSSTKKSKVTKAEVASSVKTSKTGLTVDLFDVKGKVTGTIDLPKEIFAVPVNEKLMIQAVRVYLANQHRGTVSTKTRGEVQGSTRKIYRQKGTGRARHGSLRAPIFVHGGIVFGPKPRDYSLTLPKAMRRLALFSALSTQVKAGAVKIVGDIEKIEPKTKAMANFMKQIGIPEKKKNVLLVLPKTEKGKGDSIMRAARNIEGVDITFANQLHTYAVMKHKTLLFSLDAIDSIRTVFAKETK